MSDLKLICDACEEVGQLPQPCRSCIAHRDALLLREASRSAFMAQVLAEIKGYSSETVIENVQQVIDALAGAGDPDEVTT